MYISICMTTHADLQKSTAILSVEIPDVPSVHLENWPVF